MINPVTLGTPSLQFMSKSGAVGVITDMLQSIGMEYELYDKVCL